MKIIKDEKLIKQRARIGQIVTVVSIVVLGAGLYISFTQPDLINYAFLAMILGFVLSQIGIYFGSRWGRSPRPDELISQALKGLDNKYTLYHYTSPVPHLLTGPAGIWILLPFYQGGKVRYDEKKGRWVQKGGNLYLKLFAQESIGRPDLELNAHLKDYKRFLEKNSLADIPMPKPKAAFVFTSDKVEIEAENSPVPLVNSKKLKDFIRKQAKEDMVKVDEFEKLTTTLPAEGKEA